MFILSFILIRWRLFGFTRKGRKREGTELPVPSVLETKYVKQVWLMISNVWYWNCPGKGISVVQRYTLSILDHGQCDALRNYWSVCWMTGCKTKSERVQQITRYVAQNAYNGVTNNSVVTSLHTRAIKQIKPLCRQYTHVFCWNTAWTISTREPPGC